VSLGEVAILVAAIAAVTCGVFVLDERDNRTCLDCGRTAGIKLDTDWVASVPADLYECANCGMRWSLCDGFKTRRGYALDWTLRPKWNKKETA
jgi:hypothetical protein